MCGCLQVLAALFSGIVPDAVQLVRKQLKETVPTCNHNLVASCFSLMDSLVKPYLGQEGGCSRHGNQILRCCLCSSRACQHIYHPQCTMIGLGHHHYHPPC